MNDAILEYYISNIVQFDSYNNENRRNGKISMGMAPGKKDKNWNRDLDIDLFDIVNQQVEVIVCLLNWPEMIKLGLSDYPIRAQQAGLIFYHLPIRDGNVPKLKVLQAFIPTLITHLMEGKHLLIHCRCGLGRAGTMVACCLTHFGFDADQAIQTVRFHKPKAIQTNVQEECIYLYSLG